MNFSKQYPILIGRLKGSRKYRDLDLPDAMLLDILEKADQKAGSVSDLDNRFRAKIHNIIAPYLDTIDYPLETERLMKGPDLLKDPEGEKQWAESLLLRHASSKERMPFLQELYDTIWAEIGKPSSILDLACALDPLGLPYMNLPEATTYLAYDIHGPRIELLNAYFKLAHPQAQAIQQDIVVQPPHEHADVAFFFKEAHRLEKREPGVLQSFFNSIPTATLVISLPASDLKGHHHLNVYHSRLIRNAIQGKTWELTENQVGGELLFFIRKII